MSLFKLVGVPSKEDLSTPRSLTASDSSSRSGEPEAEIVEEAAVVYQPPSNWLILQCALLCENSYDANTADFMNSTSNHSFTNVFTSGVGEYEGKLVIGEASHEGKDYTFVCFRGTDNSKDVLVDSKILQSRTNIGSVHTGFFERSQSIRLEYLYDIFKRKRSLVLTGHSLGGACASLLASRFLAQYSSYSFDSNFYCVTFGCPLFAGESLTAYMELHRDIFHHYIAEKDVVPKVLSLPNSWMNVELNAESCGFADLMGLSYRPVGKYHKLALKGSIATCDLLTKEDVLAHFTVATKLLVQKFSSIDIAAHGMAQYVTSLVKSGAVDSPPAGSTKKIQQISCEFPAVKPEMIVVFPDKLEISGTNFLLVSQCLVNGRKYKIQFVTGNVIKLEHDGSEFNERTARIALTSFMGTTVSAMVNVSHHKSSKAERSRLPQLVLRSTVPLTNMTMKKFDAANPLMNTMNQLTGHTRAIIEDSIPIEFAFAVLTKPMHNENDMQHAVVFLSRIAEVQIDDWSKLQSSFMFEVLKDAIKNLKQSPPNVIETLEDLIYKAFAKGVTTAQLGMFKNLGKTRCVTTSEVFFATTEPVNKRSYWDFIFQSGINISVSFDGPTSVNDYLVDSHTPAFEQFVYDDDNYTVTRTSSEPVQYYGYLYNTNVESILMKEYEITRRKNITLDPTDVLVYKFTHFTCASNCSLMELLSLIKTMRKLGMSKNDKPVFHIQNRVKKNVLFTQFFMLWFLLDYAGKMTLDHVDTQFSRLSNDLKGVNKTVDWLMDLQLDHKEQVIKTLDKKSSADQYYNKCLTHLNAINFKQDNATRRAISTLNDLVIKMKSRYRKLIWESMFCGLSISMDVRSITGQRVKLFEFNPPEEMGDSKEETFLSAKRLCSRLSFVSYLMDKLLETSNSSLDHCGHIIEQERTSSEAFKRFISAAFVTIPLSLYGAGKSLTAIVQWNFDHIVDVEKAFFTVWHNVYYTSETFSNYSSIVDKIITVLGVTNTTSMALSDKEKIIYDNIPNQIKDMTLSDLTNRHRHAFSKSKLESTVSYGAHSVSMMMFIYKLIYHCYHIKRLRESITIVTLAGQKNAGKTTLSVALIGQDENGEDIVKEEAGIVEGCTTIFPNAYSRLRDSSVCFVDLPGCTDQNTKAISNLFCTTSNISVFVVNARDPKDNAPNESDFTDASLPTNVAQAIKNQQGPMLICLNQADAIYQKAKDIEKARNMVKSEVADWSKGRTLGIRNACQNSSWKCEEHHPESIVHSMFGEFPLSVWLTCFEPQLNKYPELLFNADHVAMWIEEAKVFRELE